MVDVFDKEVRTDHISMSSPSMQLNSVLLKLKTKKLYFITHKFIFIQNGGCVLILYPGYCTSDTGVTNRLYITTISYGKYMCVYYLGVNETTCFGLLEGHHQIYIVGCKRQIIIIYYYYHYYYLSVRANVVNLMKASEWAEIYILIINQVDAQNFCFTITLFHASTCFENLCAHHQEVKIVLYYTASGIITLKQVSGPKLLKYNSINMSTQ